MLNKKLINCLNFEIKKKIKNIDYNFAIKNLNSHKFKSEESEIPFSRQVDSKIDLKVSLKKLLLELNIEQSSPQKIDDTGHHEFGVDLEGIIKKRQKQLNMV